MEMELLEWGRLRWRSVDQEGNHDQQGDRDQGAIDILIGDQTCTHDQVGVNHDKRSRSEECGPHYVTRDQQGDRDQGGDRDRDH